jgi:NHL repeat
MMSAVRSSATAPARRPSGVLREIAKRCRLAISRRRTSRAAEGRTSVLLAPTLAALVVLTATTPAPPAAGEGSTPGARAVSTVLGPGSLAQPGGIVLDTAGDLLVADTGHCRVLALPARNGTLDGRRVTAGRTVTLAGGSCTGRGAFGHPSGVAVDTHGDVFVAEATAQRVLEISAGSGSGTGTGRGTGPHVATAVGTGHAGYNTEPDTGPFSELNEPMGVAVDGAGDLFIADTANCRVRVLPVASGMLFGQAVTAGRVATVAGTGVCGSQGQGGPLASAELWDPVAVAVDAAGDLLVADGGDQSVLVAPARSGTYWGTSVAAGDVAVVVGGTGSYGPYLGDGLSATGPLAELNDARGLALDVSGTLYVSDGLMHAVRMVPASTGTVLGRAVTAGDLYTAAGALPVSNAVGSGDGTRWILTTLGTPTGVAVSSSGELYVADAARSTVQVIRPGGNRS